MSGQDTIFALSTAPGRAGIAVVRLSGPKARGALAAMGGPADPVARQARLVDLRSPADGGAIDRALVLSFPAPRSFTGEDMVEFHLHGGPAVVKAALEALTGLAGLRLAEPGEFTRRAFDGGKLDLTEVEGLADLIAAETEAQRRQALRQLRGALSAVTEDWRQQLLAALAHMEATIDFPDEDLPREVWNQAKDRILELKDSIAQHLSENTAGERLRHGYHIAIVGPPNVGKSSLLNALAQRDVAIVAETAGTTRDVIEVHLDLGGYPVTLVDTAGLRDEPAGRAIGAVEMEGMRRARDRAASADLKVVVADIRDWPDLGAEVEDLINGAAILVLNKMDLASTPDGRCHRGRPLFAVSAKAQTGLDTVLHHLKEMVTRDLGVSGAAPSLTRLRHRQALEACRDSLTRALTADEAALAAEDLRLAVRALGRITGQVDVEDLLDVIFKEFCIGK